MGTRGQAAIESALVLPLVLFLVLGIVQLALMQQARLMTDYAAYQAARAGVVWSGNNERMRDAATFALLPTLGRSDDWSHLSPTWQRAQRDALVRVDTVSPERGDWKELDDALLQVRLRYWYELRVPFANHVIFLAWFAANGGTALWGAIDRTTTHRQNMLGRGGDAEGLTAPGIAVQHGLPIASPQEMAELWEKAGAHRFFVPLSATQSMRMQSSFFEKWAKHP
jgi:hypothetical protein